MSKLLLRHNIRRKKSIAVKTILVVEDEMYMVNLLNIHLSNEYKVINAKDGAVALQYINESLYDLIILDIMLPYVDGWKLCEKIREKGGTPILMLTARTELSDKVRGLEIGADDYLVKPFEFDELKARVKALIRRSRQNKISNSPETKEIILFEGMFRLDLESRQLYINSQFVELTAKEFNLLSLLASSSSRVFTRDVLLDQIWDDYEIRDLRIVDTHIKNIRIKMKKVEKDVKFIKTIWGVGYSLQLKEEIE
ncbi:response regulator transcription factor [Gottfriedia acidiceleris]|uniref:response regulator transcription factor n=1 Tax=Gottfriedia acidiceleris TaxID=371036 RepID=UPI003D1F2974